MAKNKFFAALPYPVELQLKTLGANLRTARTRRNITIQELANKIGTGTRAIADAEKGKATTGIAIYLGIMWALDLLNHMDKVVSPITDEEGLRLAMSKEKGKAYKTTEIDNDF